jgi:hypothetical protein
MEQPADIRKKTRPRLDFFGAFGFVVLITTVIYAVITAT